MSQGMGRVEAGEDHYIKPKGGAMASYVRFMVYAAGKSSISFVPKGFMSQFKSAPPAVNDLPSPQDAEFLAAAADCGYGSGACYRVGMALGDWLDLLEHLQREGEQVRSLFSVTPSSPTGSRSVQPKPFVATLQSSERTSLSYAIGSIYARLATERWHAHPARAKGGAPKRFWHFSIAHHAAVQVVGLMKNHESDSPDYIVEDAKGQWSAVEAKGSLGKFENRTACEGMKQSCKFQRIAFLCPIKHLIYVHPVGDRVCVYTYVDRSNELQTVHIDPPGDDVAGSVDWNGDLIISESADLVRFDEAMMQYISLVGGLPHAGPYQSAEIIWAPALDGQGRTYGVLGVHATLWPRVRRAVSILQFITPWLSSMRRRAIDMVAAEIELDNFSAFWSDIRRTTGNLSSDDPESAEVSLAAAYQLFLEMKDMDRPLTWQVAMQLLWTSDLLGSQVDEGRGLPASIYALWKAITLPMMELIGNYIREQSLDRLLPRSSPAHSVPEVAVSSHGLFVRVTPHVRNRGVESTREFG